MSAVGGVRVDKCISMETAADVVHGSDTVPMLTSTTTSGYDQQEDKSEGFLKITRKYVPTVKLPSTTCSSLKRFLLLFVGISLVALSLVLMVTGTIRFHQCHVKQIPAPWDNKFLGHHLENVVALNNLALEKPARQSSTDFGDPNKGPAGLAVDGDPVTCSQTDEEIKPFWQVDLGRIRAIKTIMITGPSGNEFRGLSIYVGDNNNTSDAELCFRHGGSLISQVVTSCEDNISGRYITVELSSPKTKPNQQLSLCEVMVTQR